MAYNEDFPTSRQKDLVLSPNEYMYLRSATNGTIKVHTGPTMASVSGQESLVILNPKTKQFEETSSFEKARQLFVSAPEGFYVVLKNPAVNNQHPQPATAMIAPELQVGRKINITGPTSFSLFPGQMAKVVQGHRLRSNQYLMARVYDADAANANSEDKHDYFTGQLLIIKGTEVSFYIPPTGIEVLADKHDDRVTYVRDAVTLERLEYAILLDENGEKSFHHGPAVVFPKPTETFVKSNKGVIFRALELSPISGIYIKVIAEYTDDKKVVHPVGEEQFITGNDQMIYYPRPEHALIQYDGKYMHHAIAIPEGEGRYILNRLTGKINTVKGPAMYLPDPRTEVVVKRKLTERECNLMFPGNAEAMRYNKSLNEQAMEKLAKSGKAVTDAVNCAYTTSKMVDSLAIFEANSNISRGSSYTKPRTITLDTRYDGVVSINIWAGYAVSIVNKDGKRHVVTGPATCLLDYDETLETFENPITHSPDVYMPITGVVIEDSVNGHSADNVQVRLSTKYTLSFDETKKDNWFTVADFATMVRDTMRNKIKDIMENTSIEDFYHDAAGLIKSKVGTCEFEPNGTFVSNIEINDFQIQKDIGSMLNQHQTDIINHQLELSKAKAEKEVIEALEENRRREITLHHENDLYKLKLKSEAEQAEYEQAEEMKMKRRIAYEEEQKAQQNLIPILDAINQAKVNRIAAENAAKLEYEQKKADIEKFRQDSQAEATKKIMESIAPDLIAALQTQANAQLMTDTIGNMAPYALAKGESAADFINTLLRGTTLENVVKNMTPSGK